MRHSRSWWIAKSAVVLLLAATALAGCEPTANNPVKTSAAPPNIILIVADDMGYTDLGAFGSEINTPNLDRLALEGIRLTNYHASPQCAPTRSMLMSGADNHTAGMGSMFGANFIKGGFGDRPGYEQHLHPRVATLPERLGDAGYHTYMAGKWHLGMGDDKQPTARGFEEAFVLMGGHSNHMEMRALGPVEFREHGAVLTSLPENFYSTNTYTDKMIEYIDANQGDGKPFFGYLALTSPHWPLQAPPEFVDRYAGQYDDGYEALRVRRAERAAALGVAPAISPDRFEVLTTRWSDLSAEEQRYASRKMEIYAAMVDNMDYNVGRLIAYLQESGDFENTLFFFMSDNGAESDREDRNPTFVRGVANNNYDNSFENLGNASSWVDYGPGWAQASMGPYRLFKGFMTEGGTRVSAFAYHPTLTATAARSDQYLTLMDVMPTFLDVAGAEFDPTEVRGRKVEAMQGRSFRSVLQGKAGLVHSGDEVIATELHGQRALVRGDWKIVWEQTPANIWWELEPPAHWQSWQLYNLADDPTERNDLSAAQPEMRDELVALWHQWALDNNVMESVTPYWPDAPADQPVQD